MMCFRFILLLIIIIIIILYPYRVAITYKHNISIKLVSKHSLSYLTIINCPLP